MDCNPEWKIRQVGGDSSSEGSSFSSGACTPKEQVSPVSSDAPLKEDSFCVFLSPEGEEFRVYDTDRRLRRMSKAIEAWSKEIRGLFGDCERIGVCLTYAPDQEWEPKDISRFMKRVRKHLGKRLKAYAWVAELQGRGAVHYHVLLIVERGARIPFPDKEGWWVKGMTNVSRRVGWRYLVKYLQKEGQKGGRFPKGLRCYGISILWKGEDVRRWEAWWRVREALLPAWFRRIVAREEVIAWGKEGALWWYVEEGRARRFVHSPYRFMGRWAFDEVLGKHVRVC